MSEKTLTIFSIPKPFTGHVGLIQMNAVRSWAELPDAQVWLFGDETGVAEAARTVGARHVTRIDKNDFGTPLVSDAFVQVRKDAGTELCVYVNSDIIVTPEFVRIALETNRCFTGPWLMIGRRHDLDVSEPIEFGQGWDKNLGEVARQRGVEHGPSGLDYFVFPSSLPTLFPRLAVGRPGWDNWFIFDARSRGIPVIDASSCILCVHQNHPPAYTSNGVEARQNTAAGGGRSALATLRDANWRLQFDSQGRVTVRRRLLGDLMFSPLVRSLVSLKRTVQNGI